MEYRQVCGQLYIINRPTTYVRNIFERKSTEYFVGINSEFKADKCNTNKVNAGM